MNLTARDKKVAMILTPIALAGVFWMFVLSPKREEAAKLGEDLAQAELARDQAQAQAGTLQGARESYANDYAVVVRLGKAIPTSVDMPSLIVQLDGAAKGTGIRFSKVTAGTRTEAAAATPAPAAPPAAGAPAAQPGGEQAQTGFGKTAEKAGEAGQTSDERNAAGGADAPPPAAGTPAPSGAAAAAPGLDTVPLEFSFTGGFFDLADFFHEMKRFVYLANGRVKVQGRLLTIDSFKFDSTAFPALKTDVQATVYLSPKEQGATAGATPTGPAPAAAAPAAQAPPAAAAPETATPANSTEGIQ